jgi:pimeloyl-ACP methyl ester carboxylesterase
MLLLHGITDDGLCWTRIALDLQDRYDLVMPDARGHGRSGRLTGSLAVPELAADAAGLIHALGLTKPTVFGHSMGAITALALAAGEPDLVDAVILADPPLRDAAVPPAPEFIAELRKEFGRMREMTAEQRTALGAAQNPGWHPLEVQTWAQSKVEFDPAVLSQLRRFDEYPWRDAVSRMRCPGLLITGDPDRQVIVTPAIAAEVLAMWKDGEMVRIARAGHSIHRDRYEETMAAVHAFLARQPGAVTRPPT